MRSVSCDEAPTSPSRHMSVDSMGSPPVPVSSQTDDLEGARWQPKTKESLADRLPGNANSHLFAYLTKIKTCWELDNLINIFFQTTRTSSNPPADTFSLAPRFTSTQNTIYTRRPILQQVATVLGKKKRRKRSNRLQSSGPYLNLSKSLTDTLLPVLQNAFHNQT